MGSYQYRYLGQAYGSGKYGNCAYNASTSCSTTSTGGGTAGTSGTLTNTGFMVAAIVTVACIIILVAILVRWWRRPRSKVQKSTPTQVTPPQDDKKL